VGMIIPVQVKLDLTKVNTPIVHPQTARQEHSRHICEDVDPGLVPHNRGCRRFQKIYKLWHAQLSLNCLENPYNTYPVPPSAARRHVVAPSILESKQPGSSAQKAPFSLGLLTLPPLPPCPGIAVDKG